MLDVVLFKYLINKIEDALNNHFIHFSKYHTLTPLRLNKNYIIYFHLWTWIFLTGRMCFLYYIQKVCRNSNNLSINFLLILGILPFSVLALINSKIYFSIKRLKTSLRKNSPSPKNR